MEGRERLQKEEKLNKADKKISLATEELSTYRYQQEPLESLHEHRSVSRACPH